MEPLTIEQVAGLCGNGAELKSNEPKAGATGVSIDTRSLGKGNVFVALKGENTDGHHYINQAFKAGASAALVERQWAGNQDSNSSHSFIVVDEPLSSLRQWAMNSRAQAKYKVVAVTGSNGKTTAKEMMHQVLSTRLRTEKSKGNFNNHIGLPLTIINTKEDAEVSVLEMGANHLGEIAELSQIARPDIAVITGIGYGHVGLFGSIENVAKAKLEIACGLKQNGVLLLNGDDPLLLVHGNGAAPSIEYFSTKGGKGVQAENIGFDELAQPTFQVEGVHFHLKFSGMHSIYNALSAICVGKLLGIALPQMAEALGAVEPVKGRLFSKTISGIALIDDSYNANPTSVKASLETFALMRVEGRRYAVLGDMLELGHYAESMHYEIGRAAAEEGISKLFVLGEFAHCIKKGFIENEGDPKMCLEIQYPGRVLNPLIQDLRQGDAVLFKASNKLNFGKLVERIETELAKRG